MNVNTAFNIALVVVSALWLAFLFAAEAYTQVKHIPSISERLTSAGRTAPIIFIIAIYVLGVLTDHFWGHP